MINEEPDYQEILSRLEEQWQKYRQGYEYKLAREINKDIRLLNEYLAHTRNTPPDLTRWKVYVPTARQTPDIEDESTPEKVDRQTEPNVQSEYPLEDQESYSEEIIFSLVDSGEAPDKEAQEDYVSVESEIGKTNGIIEDDAITGIQVDEIISPVEESTEKGEIVRSDESRPALEEYTEQSIPVEDEIEEFYNARSFERFQEEIHTIEKLIAGSDEELVRAVVAFKNLTNMEGDLNEAERLQLGSMYREAIEERDRRYNTWMEKGRNARKEGDLDLAQQAFTAAYTLIHIDEALNALAELNRQADRKTNEAALGLLGYELANRTDLGKLEKALREAETLSVAGQLPDRLVEPMNKAREYFDDKRLQMSNITTAAVIGDLTAAHNAIIRIQHLMEEEKQEDFFDRLRGYVPISDALQEANRFWEDRSREFVADTHTKVEKWLNDRPDQPEIAESILLTRLYIGSDPTQPQPIHQSVIDDLNADKQKIDLLLTKKHEAQVEVDKAGMAVDPIQAYQCYIKASDKFSCLPGLLNKLDRARPQALNYLLTLVKEKFTSAEWEKDHFYFENAQQALQNAHQKIILWPDDERPRELEKQRAVCEDLALVIREDEQKFEEFTRRLEEVKRLEQKDEIDKALEMLENLLEDEAYSSDERYKQYTQQDLRALNKKLTATKSVGEKLELARKAVQEQNWEKVRDITQGLADKDARAFYHMSLDELRIQEALEWLRQDYVRKAKEILDPLIKRRPNLHERLVDVIDIIDKAVKATPQFQPFYDQAVQEAKKQGVAEQAEALRLFRYLSGKPLDDESAQPTWPLYMLSLLTAPAREEALALAERMRTTVLADLLVCFKRCQLEQINPNPQKSAILAAQVRALREAFLLQSEEERMAARWIELLHGVAEAKVIAEAGFWDKAVTMWEELDLIYPLALDVQDGLKQAYIQQALQQMRKHMDQNRFHEALKVLQDAQQRAELIDSTEIKFGLSEVYERLQQFEKAKSVLKTVQSQNDTEIEKARNDRIEYLIREEKIQKALVVVDDLKKRAASGTVKEAERRKLMRGALEVLKNTLAGENGIRSQRLETQYNELYHIEEILLLENIDEEQAKHTPEGNLRALLSIVDLEQLENLEGSAKNKKKSRKKLANFKSTLGNLVKYLSREARKLDPNPDNYDFVDESAVHLFEKVIDYRSKFQIVKDYCEDQQIVTYVMRLSTIASNLSWLLKRDEESMSQIDAGQDAVLDGGKHSRAWNNAVVTNDFTILERTVCTLEEKQLQRVAEVREFTQKLAEVKRVVVHLNDIIADIRILYREEKFPEVIKRIETARDRNLLEDALNFVVVDDILYQEIYNWIASRLMVSGYNEEDRIFGWEDVRRDAEKREDNFEIWKTWTGNVQIAVDQAKAALLVAEQFDRELPWYNAQPVIDMAVKQSVLADNSGRWLYRLLEVQNEMVSLDVHNPAGETFSAEFIGGDNIPLTYRLWSWIDTVKYAGIAWLMLEGGPAHYSEMVKIIEKIGAAATKASKETTPNRMDGKESMFLGEVIEMELQQDLEAFPVLSKKAANHRENGLVGCGNFHQLFLTTRQKLQNIHTHIETLQGYPQAGEFITLQRQRAWDRFEKRLQQARQIGPASANEAKYYRIAKRTFEDQGNKKPGWLSRIFGSG